MSKKSLRIILIPLVLIFVLIAVICGSKFEITTCINKDKTEIDDASSIGFKMYSNNEINSNIERKTFQEITETKVLNQSIVKNYQQRLQQVMLVLSLFIVQYVLVLKLILVGQYRIRQGLLNLIQISL
jgi:DNA topoisomerase IB